jgi:hypothetical protein
MPTNQATTRARKAKREGKSASTQASAFVKEEMHAFHAGKGNAKSAKQAVAIGLSEARRAGVKAKAPNKGEASAKTREKAKRDLNHGEKATAKKTRSKR